MTSGARQEWLDDVGRDAGNASLAVDSARTRVSFTVPTIRCLQVGLRRSGTTFLVRAVARNGTVASVMGVPWHGQDITSPG
jgi:hypothetical protein